jgi:hypothetical protein
MDRNEKKIIITKAEETSKPQPRATEEIEPISLPSAGKRNKTLRTYPKGILKGVKDPSKSPPLRKGMKKHTIRLFTEKGSRKHKKTLRKKIAKMSDEKVRMLVLKHGLLKNPNTPSAVMRDMLEGGMVAGFISLD